MKTKLTFTPVICTKCNRKDISTKTHVGTSITMRCSDCCDASGKAQLCRYCCPTGHRTRFPQECDNR